MSNDQIVSLYAAVYGSLYFSAVLSTMFYGIACIQLFVYYVHYEDDPLQTKIFVTVLWYYSHIPDQLAMILACLTDYYRALNTIHEALTVSGVYRFIMNGLKNPLSFVVGNPELIFIYVLTAVVAIPAQGFLVYRLYVFSKKNIIAPIAWAVTALVVLVCSIIYVSKALYEMDGLQVVPIDVLDSNPAVTLATICFSVAAGADILIAISMTFLLHRERATIGFARTTHLLQRLTMFAINTGTWTATFAVLTLVMLYVYQSNLIYTVFCIPICSVYCNTILANLNARGYLRGDDIVHTDLFLTPSMRVADTGIAKV